MGDELKHPGSWIGDSVEEFKKLPTAGKIGVGAAVLGVIAIAIYEKNKASAAAGSSTSGLSSATTAGGAAGSSSPFPLVNGLPVLPSGTNPLYGPDGSLVGYQPTPTPTTPTTTPPPGIVPPSRVSTATQPPPQPKINGNPLVPNNLMVWMGKGGVLYQGTSSKDQRPVNLGKNSGIRAGSNGRYWVFNSSGQQLITNNFRAQAPA